MHVEIRACALFAALLSCAGPRHVESSAASLETRAAHELAFRPEVFALELDVPDVERAVRFYVEAFDFETSPGLTSSRLGVVECTGGRLVLRPSTAEAPAEGAASWSINLRVADLERTLARARAAGAIVRDEAPRRIPIGRSVQVQDPFGHVVHLIDVDDDQPAHAVEVLNFGANAAQWEEIESTFVSLGFEVWSRDYLPLALPLVPAGATPLVLHASVTGASASAMGASDRLARSERLVLAVETLEPAQAALVERGFGVGAIPFAAGSLGKSFVFRSKGRLSFRVLEHSPSALAFDRLRSLAGDWEGSSDNGWTSRIRIEVIAGGSAVLESTLFSAHPGETMVTLFHRDGARLLLTHYCVAGNQPRLVASAFEDGGDTVRFTYVDGTNLASRDQGHMDQAVFRFAGADRFSSTWNWYQDGKEGWRETIEYRRVCESSPAGAATRTDDR